MCQSANANPQFFKINPRIFQTTKRKRSANCKSENHKKIEFTNRKSANCHFHLRICDSQTFHQLFFLACSYNLGIFVLWWNLCNIFTLRALFWKVLLQAELQVRDLCETELECTAKLGDLCETAHHKCTGVAAYRTACWSLRDHAPIPGRPPHQDTGVAVYSEACWSRRDHMHRYLTALLVKIQCSGQQSLLVSARLCTNTWRAPSSGYVVAVHSNVCWSLRDYMRKYLTVLLVKAW